MLVLDVMRAVLATRYGFSLPKFALLSLFTVTLVACGGSGSSGSGGSTCKKVTLLDDFVAAGDLVELKTGEQLEALFLASGDGDIGQSFAPSSAGYQFAVPITAALATQGGTLHYRAKIDGKLCDLDEITVEPLPEPANENAYSEVLDTLEQVLEQFEASFGFDPDAVTDADLEQDPFLLTAYFIHEIFNNPISEISLPYQRDVFANLTEDEKIYVAQILEKVGLLSMLNDLGALFDGPIFVSQSEPAQAAAFSPEPMTTRATCSGNYADTSKHRVTIINGENLSRGMKLSYAAQEKLNNAQYNAVANARKSTVINTLSTVGSQVKGGILAGPLAVLGTTSALVSIRSNMELEMVAALLPTEISSAELQILPKRRLEEDYTEKFAKPIWLFKASARSKEYDISKLVADTGLAVLGVPNSPVNGNLVLGLTEVSNQVTQKAKARDCELIVPSISWPNIQIDTDYATASFISGTAFALEDANSRVITPTEIGSAELEVKMKSDQFPSFVNTLADYRDSKILENLAKQFVYSQSPIVVDEPGDTAQVSVEILNSVSPESYTLTHSVALGVSRSRTGNTLNLVIDTPSDPQLFPQSVTLRSTSKSLSPTGDRANTAPVQLDDLEVRIEETLAGTCEDDVYVEENRAFVDGFANDKTVTWQTSGGTITLLPNNGVRFSTTELGTYVLKATSNEDTSVSASVTIKTLDCSGNVYMNAQVVTNTEMPQEDSNCPTTNPDDVDVETRYGIENDDYDGLSPATIRSKIASLSVGRPFNFSQSDSGMLSYSELINDTCFTKSLNLVANSQGTVENIGDNAIGFGTSHVTEGECFNVPLAEGGSRVECITAGAVAQYIMAWVFDHEAEAEYDLILDMSCSAKPIPGFPSFANLSFYIFTYDSSGQRVDVLPLTVPPAHFSYCVDGVNPSDHSWLVPAMEAGSKVMIFGTFADSVTASPGANEAPTAKALQNRGDTSGFIQVKVK